LFRSVERINASRIDLALEVLKGALVGPLEGATLGVWGAAFKPHTDDVREAPSLMLIQALLDNGTKVKVYDPKAMDKLKGLLGRKIEYAKDAYDAASDVDAIALATEWPEFLEVSFERVKGLMRQPVVLDCRGHLRALQLESKGFYYATLHGPAMPPAPISAGSLL
jgi:UDPglucose 6-dehydrogenase